MRLIDADELSWTMYHEAFETDSDMQKWDGGCWIRYKMFENAINSAPTIAPDMAQVLAYECGKAARKKGKWIKHPEVKNIYGGIYIECSECHTKYVVQHIEDEKYCRNCGAKMLEGEE